MTLLHPDVRWQWRDDIETIRVARFLAEDFDELVNFPHEHRGESPKFALRTSPNGPIEYLLKFGHEAVVEIAYSAMARALDLPFQTVHWARYSGLSMPLAAVYFEPTAVEAELEGYGQPEVQAAGQRITASNPWDVFGHAALYKLVDGVEEVQWMIKDGILFGIDAATMFSQFQGVPAEYARRRGRASGVLKATREALAHNAYLRQDWIEWTMNHTEQHWGLDATQAMRRSLEAIARADNLAGALRARLEASPSKAGRLYAELLPEYVEERQRELHAAGFGPR